ncbi:hypothetical protein MRB53_001461 [Persea americana]|uniref:Uncharacterized protein n=1 Tax=Persea americana TaxID=3435 RepID=A0ACC2MSF6_PERAE|nr:hypothetical protein MRB53_001461 [Persea americana]
MKSSSFDFLVIVLLMAVMWVKLGEVLELEWTNYSVCPSYPFLRWILGCFLLLCSSDSGEGPQETPENGDTDSLAQGIVDAQNHFQQVQSINYLA